MSYWRGRGVVVTGGHGFLGKRVVERLGILKANVRLHDRGGENVFDPEVVIHCAGKVGGMFENRERPYEYIRDNIGVGLEVLKRYEGARFINIGSSCAYPGDRWATMTPDLIWNGYPARENGPYGIAKRVVMEVVRAYRMQEGVDAYSLVFPNLYGPGMVIEPGRGHVIGGLIRKIWEAREGGLGEVEMVGSGGAVREFMYIDDAVDAILELGVSRQDPVVNVGNGGGVSIRDLAQTVAALVGYSGRLVWGNESDDGQPRKVMVSTGTYKPKVNLIEGLKKTIEWFIHRQAESERAGQPEHSAVR